MIHHLLVPGLLESPPATQETAAIPRFPALERLLARADKGTAADTLDASLYPLFHLSENTSATAPLCWLAENGEEAQGWVLQATPVYLRADRDQVLLFQLDEDQLDGQTAEVFAALFNDHFADDGLVLRVASPLRWYLFVEAPVKASFAALSQVAGRSIAAFMPQGEDAGFWRTILNETQMLFFQHPENEERQLRRQPPISGLWFSGAGRLPTQRPVAPAKISGDYCLLYGLNAYATSVDPEAEITVVDSMASAQDADAWLQAVQKLDKQLAALASGSNRLRLYPCQGTVYQWRKRMKFRFWRRNNRFGMMLAERNNRV